MKLIAILAALFCTSAFGQVNVYTKPPIYDSSSATITGGTISGVGKDTMESDAAARSTTFAGANAYPQATVNTTGGAFALSPGIGRRLVTVVDYSLIDAGVDTITLTLTNQAGTVTVNIGTEGANDATHWKAETSHAVTATNICTWAAQLTGVASATAVGASCYITFSPTTAMAALVTSMAAGEGTVTSGTDGNLTIVGGSGTNKLDNVVIGGTTAAAITGTTITATGQILPKAGAVGSPSIDWGITTGFYSAGSGVVEFTSGGANSTRFGYNTGLQTRSDYPISWASTTGFAASDLFLSRYAAKQLIISGDGIGTASGMTGWILGNNATTVSLLTHSARPTEPIITLAATLGSGLAITAGTAGTDVNALSVTQAWNAAGVTFTGIKSTTTWTAAAAGSKLVDIIQDSSSAFSILGVASGLNGLSLQMGATTVGPTISAQGEANVPLTVTSKGTGTVTLNATGSGSLTFGSGIVVPAASGTRYLCISTTGVVTSSAAVCSGT